MELEEVQGLSSAYFRRLLLPWKPLRMRPWEEVNVVELGCVPAYRSAAPLRYTRPAHLSYRIWFSDGEKVQLGRPGYARGLPTDIWLANLMAVDKAIEAGRAYFRPLKPDLAKAYPQSCITAYGRTLSQAQFDDLMKVLRYRPELMGRAR